jgi:excisionase family DNA binding protein
MTPADLSEYLGVPTGTLANWRYQRRGPIFVRIGRHVRYRSEDVARWLGSQAADSRASHRRWPVNLRRLSDGEE